MVVRRIQLILISKEDKPGREEKRILLLHDSKHVLVLNTVSNEVVTTHEKN